MGELTGAETLHFTSEMVTREIGYFTSEADARTFADLLRRDPQNGLIRLVPNYPMQTWQVSQAVRLWRSVPAREE